MSKRINYRQVAPGAAKAYAGVRDYLAGCGLPADLIDLVYLRVSQINGCAYCIDMHSRDLLKTGVSIDKLVLVPAWREARNLFSAREQAALAWAESVTLIAETGAPDDVYQATAAVFSEKELSDLTVAISLMNAYNRLGISFRLTPQAVQNASGAHPQ